MKSVRYIQQTERARIEHDLVLTRMGELALRGDNLLSRGLLYPPDGSTNAVFFEGLIGSPGAGLSVSLSIPAVVLQTISHNTRAEEVKFVGDENGGTAFNIVLDTADPTNDRIDIIEGRVMTRSEFTDLNISVADPVTQVISAETRDRDFEVYLFLQKVAGTPAGSPTPPSTTAGTAGAITGTVDINTAPIDLSSEYILSFAIEDDADFVEVDLRGASPVATTAAEILANINAVGFGTVATLSGNFLKITAAGTEENSVVKIKQPLDSTKDAFAEVLGGTESAGYYNEYRGSNAFFKVCEVLVPFGATNLSAANIRSREEKDAQWDADAATVVNGETLLSHRLASPLDHPDGSIFVNHLDSTVLNLLGGKITLYRNAFAPVYEVSGDATFRQGTMYLEDIELMKVDGNSQDNDYDVEQEFPINRVDQREEDFSSGTGYSVPVSLGEGASDKRTFTVGAAVNDGTNDYTVQDFAGNFTRVGVYVTNGGSVTGFTHMRISLHNSADSLLDSYDVPIADLTTLGTGWFYADMSATLTVGLTYHFHFELVGETAPTTVILGNQSGTGADTLAFHEMYLASAGKYGGANEADVLKLLDSGGSRQVPIRATGADDISSPGDGFLGKATGTNYDVMLVDFSNTTFWEDWRYEDYIGIDPALGKVKIPPSLDVRTLFAEYNTFEGINALDAKNFLRHNKTQSVEENLEEIEGNITALTFLDLTDTPSAYTNHGGKTVSVNSAGTEVEFTDPAVVNLMPVYNRIEALEGQVLYLTIENSYLTGRQFQTSTFLVDTFVNENLTINNIYDSLSIPAEVMDNVSWNDNWKATPDNARLDYKNGFTRPRKQPYWLEIIDEYNLEDIGMSQKCAMSKYDSVNDCYWFISHDGFNTVGAITKIAPELKDGKVTVLSRWYLQTGGGSTAWIGIDVDTDGTKLWFVKSAQSVVNTSIIYGIAINLDGTLGATGFEKSNGEQIDLTNSIYASHTMSGSGSDVGYYCDVVEWDTLTLMVYAGTNSSTCFLSRLDKSTLGTSASASISGIENYVGGSTAQVAKSLTRNGDDVYIRSNDTTDDDRFIVKFDRTSDVQSDVLVKTSGRIVVSRYVDYDSNGWEGIAYSKEGDLLEITSTGSGKIMTRRAMKNALWAENQINKEHKPNASTNPNAPYAMMADPSGNYWTGDTSVTANQVDLYRFDTDGEKWSVRLTGASWTYVIALCTDGTTVWIIGHDNTNYEIYFGTLSALNTAIELANAGAGDYDAANTLDVTSWGTLASGIGAANTNVFSDITYDKDRDIIWILNDTDDKIDTLSTDGTIWTQGVIDLPTPTSSGQGLAYNNNKLYVGDYTAGTLPGVIHVLDIERSTSTEWFKLHTYQDPSRAYESLGRWGFDFDGNDLICLNRVQLFFYRMKTLADPDVLQLHTFLETPLVLSNSIRFITPMATRYFNNPVDYADERDMPDINYFVVGYGNEGFSLVHCDEFLSDKSSTGKDRRDVRKLRIQHFKDASSNLISVNFECGSISIEKELLIIGSEYAGGSNSALIDLKSGQTTYLGISTPGTHYDGSLSERNDAKGYTTLSDNNFIISNLITHKIHAHTFTKDDASDYQGENPVTCVLIGGDGGCDLLRIDWDSNNNRTPVKVFNNIFNNTLYGRYACYIAPSGYVFGGGYDSSGEMFFISAETNVPDTVVKAWEIGHDGGASNVNKTQIGSGLMEGFTTDISPTSRVWKTASGSWRHRLVVAGLESGASGVGRLGIIDVENETIEDAIYNNIGSTNGLWQCDNFEDILFGSRRDGTNGNIHMFHRLPFDDSSSPLHQNGWTAWELVSNSAGHINRFSRPRLFTNQGSEDIGLRYSKDHNMLMSCGNTNGGVLFHFPHIDQSVHESLEFDTTNPALYHYLREVELPVGEKTEIIQLDNGNIAYTNGATQAWEFILADAIDLANDFKLRYSNHIADATEHGNGADGTNTVAAADATDLTTLITLVTELLTDYDVHEDDAELGAGWAYHNAQESTDHTPASTAAPTDLNTCTIRLLDLQVKFNAHDADSLAHTAGSLYQLVERRRVQIARDGVTEGSLELTGLVGYARLSAYFLTDDNSGGAWVGFVNTTNQANGDTHNATAVLDNLANVTELGLRVGMVVEGTNIPAGTKILTVDSTTQVTLDANSTGDATGVNLVFYHDIDLYHAEAGEDHDQTIQFVSGSLTDTYKIKIVHSGLNNAGVNDYLMLQGFLIATTLTAATIPAQLTLRHTDFPSDTYAFAAAVGSSEDIEKQQTYNGNGSDTEFTLSGTNHAAVPVAFSADSGATWLQPTSLQLTWGSNGPNYDNETLDASKQFTVKFDTAPLSGTDNVIIKFRPYANKHKLEHTLTQPNDGGTFVDRGRNVRLIDYALEIV